LAEILTGTNTWSGSNTFHSIIVTNLSGPGTTNFLGSEVLTNYVTQAEAGTLGQWTTNATGIAYTGGTVRVDTGDLTVSNDVDVIGGVTSATLNVSGAAVASTLTVDAEPYAVGWSSDLTVPTKDDVYDKIETLGGLQYLTTPGVELTWNADDVVEYFSNSQGGAGTHLGPHTWFFRTDTEFASTHTWVQNGWWNSGNDPWGFHWYDLGIDTSVDTNVWPDVAMADWATYGMASSTPPYRVYADVDTHQGYWTEFDHGATLTFETGHIYALVEISDYLETSEDHVATTHSMHPLFWPGAAGYWQYESYPGASWDSSWFTHTNWEVDVTSGYWDEGAKAFPIVSNVVDPSAGTNSVSSLSLNPTIGGVLASENLTLTANPIPLGVGDGVAGSVYHQFNVAGHVPVTVTGTIDTYWNYVECTVDTTISGLSIGLRDGWDNKTWDIWLKNIDETVTFASGTGINDGNNGSVWSDDMAFDTPYTCVAGEFYVIIFKMSASIVNPQISKYNDSDGWQGNGNFRSMGYGAGLDGTIERSFPGIDPIGSTVTYEMRLVEGDLGYSDANQIIFDLDSGLVVTNAAGTVNVDAWVPVPSTAADTGYPGQKAYASGFLYICVGTDTWERVAIATW